jgi:hypothetical protein
LTDVFPASRLAAYLSQFRFRNIHMKWANRILPNLSLVDSDGFASAHDRVHAAVVLLWRGEFPQKQFFTYKPGNASGKYNYYGVRNGERWATTYNYGDPYRQLESDIDWPILAFSQEEQDFAASRTMASPGSEAEVIGNSWP